MSKQYEITAAECARLIGVDLTMRVIVKIIDGDTVEGKGAELEHRITINEPPAGIRVSDYARLSGTHAYLVTLN